jgi:hypothetical protein
MKIDNGGMLPNIRAEPDHRPAAGGRPMADDQHILWREVAHEVAIIGVNITAIHRMVQELVQLVDETDRAAERLDEKLAALVTRAGRRSDGDNHGPPTLGPS